MFYNFKKKKQKKRIINKSASTNKNQLRSKIEYQKKKGNGMKMKEGSF